MPARTINEGDTAEVARPHPHVCITYHAVTRYVQRVLHIVVDGKFPDERTSARVHCAAAGLTIDKARREIWTPGIALAVASGFTSVDNGRFEAAISQPRGVITTIKAPRVRDSRRMIVLSDREFQRRAKRMIRTNKRRPSAGRTRELSGHDTHGHEEQEPDVADQ